MSRECDLCGKKPTAINNVARRGERHYVVSVLWHDSSLSVNLADIYSLLDVFLFPPC